MIPSVTDTAATTGGARPLLDQLIADWNSLTIELDGRTVLLPAQPRADDVVFNVVLPLHETTPETVAPARLWAASLLRCRHGSTTLQERIEELGGELTMRITAGSVVLTGSCIHSSLTAALDAVRRATHGPGPGPERLRATARELADQQLLYWDNIEARAQSLARRAAFGLAAPLPAPSLHQELTGLTPCDVEDYRSRRTDPGWLIVDAADAPRWPEPDAPESNGLTYFQPGPPAEQVAPIIAAHPGRGIAALAFAGVLHPDVAEHCETWLASTVLGGYFASRLWERLRARHSRAYSPRSMLEHSAAGTNVLVTATTTSEDLPATVRAVREELTRLCRHEPDGPELHAAKSYLLGSLLRSASGGRRLSALVATWLARGVHPHQLLTSAATIRDVTPDDVVRAARDTLAPSVMSLAVCGACLDESPQL